MIETVLSDLEIKLDEAKIKRDVLWNKFQEIEKEVEPYLDRMKTARTEWYAQSQRVDVLEAIKKEITQ